MENQVKSPDIKIRYDADEPMHPATINFCYMMTELIQAQIECQPIYNCTKSIRKFLTPETPFEDDHRLARKTLDFQLPLMVYTTKKGKKKVVSSEASILQALVKGTELAIDDHQLITIWLPLAKEIRILMKKLYESVFDEFLENKTQDVIMVVDHRLQTELDKILDKLENSLIQPGNNFLAGNTLTIADLVVICELFPTFAKIEKSARDLRKKYTNVLCWLKRLDGIYSIGYVLRQSVDLYPNEEYLPARLVPPMLPVLEINQPSAIYFDF